VASSAALLGWLAALGALFFAWWFQPQPVIKKCG
jgi:hypothetical protein